MGHRMDVVLAGMKTLISYISIRALGWPGALSMSSNILKGFFFFFWAVGPNNGLKIVSEPYCKQMYIHPGFVLPFIEHRQNRLSIILKGPRIFVNEHWLLLEVTSCISPKQESLPFEVLKSGIDFSSLAMEILDGIFLQCEAVSSTLKIHVV